MRRPLRFAFPLLGISLLAAAPSLAAEAESAPALGVPEVFDGQVLDAGGAVPRATSAFFSLHVDRYTTDEELAGFLTILRDQGENALRLALEKVEVGWVKIGNALGYPIAIARQYRTEQGRVIRIATARQMALFEVMRNTRSTDYPFGMIELAMPDEGKGEGKLLAAVSVDITAENRLEIKSYGTQPFRVLQVRRKPAQKR